MLTGKRKTGEPDLDEEPERKKSCFRVALQGDHAQDFPFGPCPPPPGDPRWTQHSGLNTYTHEPSEFLNEYLESVMEAPDDEDDASAQDYKTTGLVALLVYKRWWENAKELDIHVRPTPPPLHSLEVPDSLKAGLLASGAEEGEEFPSVETLDHTHPVASQHLSALWRDYQTRNT